MHSSRRHTLCARLAAENLESDEDENTSLLASKGPSASNLGKRRAQQALPMAKAQTIAHPDGKGPDPPSGPIGYVAELARNYGGNFIVYLSTIEHVMKGFVCQLCQMAEPYIYASYSVPAPEMQMYLSLVNLPWAMKPIIGLVSDAFPVGGYSKAPYILVTSLLGASAFATVGVLPHASTPLMMLVACCFLMTLQVVTADILTQGKFTQKVKESRSLTGGTDLLTFVYMGIDAASLIAVMGSGFIINSFGAKSAYLISAVPAVLCVIPLLSGGLEEKQMSGDEMSEIRQGFLQQKVVCSLVLLMFLATIAIPVTIVASGDAAVIGIVSVGVWTLMFVVSSLVLNPAIAAVNAYTLAQSVLTLKIDAAAFYFFTDTSDQYPGGPNFSKLFFNTCLGSVQFAAGLAGIITYQKLSKKITYRKWVVMANIAAAAANLSNILLFKRVNLLLGVPDWIWAICSNTVYFAVERWRWMPLFTAFSYLAPAGMEATMFALLMGCHNLGTAVAGNLGAWLLQALQCRPQGATSEAEQFAGLWKACAWLSVVPPVAAILLCHLLPDVRQNKSLLKSARDGATDGSLARRWEK
ncbi:unnamed protein product [Prorocentrum cordatum]|uniref:Uncharacterized protein n=1 Tax=Prorocentrum cordatum TaxID=2364126 RepID=A0ABN9TYS9_9DINO|nr:unnamed protein product [Polarella glacialis]|mmetsp:Transcript_18693/g.50245  ORF Transcript_18693/g.50245 Transcript_18693/m.50245 type:complete len:582 (+) Transcript_18693:87-1832(+)